MADAAVPLLQSSSRAFPWLRRIFTGGVDAGDKLRGAPAEYGDWTIEIIKQSDALTELVALPKLRVVECNFTWVSRNRRLAKDFKAAIANTTTSLTIAGVKLMSRQLADA